MKIRTFKEQCRIRDAILRERLDVILPKVMQECGIDLWLIPSREYNEDPIFQVMTPSGFPTARRLSILILHNTAAGLHRYCVNLHDHELEAYYTQDWDNKKETQIQALIRVLRRCEPRTIAIDRSADFAYCDGLSAGLYDWLMTKLPEDITNRFVCADPLAIRFLETRGPLEREVYPEVMAVALDIIDKAYSRRTIQVGATTCRDLEWAMMEMVKAAGLNFWFSPTIDLQRSEGMYDGDTVIMAGDLLHCDFGITYLGLCTDTQRLAYVLKPGETAVPAGLVAGMDINNRFQDIVCAELKTGRSGNEVFSAALAQAAQAGITAMLYTHPLGIFGHAPGPTIGLYSDQHPQPVKGDLLIHPDTAYALELNTKSPVAGYKNAVIFFTEESVLYTNDKVGYLAAGRESIMEI